MELRCKSVLVWCRLFLIIFSIYNENFTFYGVFCFRYIIRIYIHAQIYLVSVLFRMVSDPNSKSGIKDSLTLHTHHIPTFDWYYNFDTDG